MPRSPLQGRSVPAVFRWVGPCRLAGAAGSPGTVWLVGPGRPGHASSRAGPKKRALCWAAVLWAACSSIARDVLRPISLQSNLTATCDADVPWMSVYLTLLIFTAELCTANATKTEFLSGAATI